MFQEMRERYLPLFKGRVTRHWEQAADNLKGERCEEEEEEKQEEEKRR